MRHFRIICAISILALFSSVCFADDLELETITVTAEKRAEDAQKVPVPMNVMTETFVQDAGLRNMSDVGRYLPNISLDTNWGINQTWVVSRGLTSNDFLATSPMVLNVDGLPSDSNFGYNFTFEDVERIEVLRGPQGTLYGKNAMSGAINVVTKKPDNNLTGKIGFTAEERNTYKASFAVSGPIQKDRFYFGLSGGYAKTDGYLDDKTPGAKEHVDETEKYHYALKLRATPTQKTDISLKYAHNNATGGNPPVVFSDSHTYDIYSGFADSEYADTKSVTDILLLNMDFALDSMKIQSITSYKKVDSDETVLMGYQQGAYTMGRQDFEMPTFTQELRFSSTDKSTIKWLGGLYYDRNKMDVNNMSSIYDYTATVYSYDWRPETDSDTKAVFAEATLPLFSDVLALTLGGRYETTHREMDYRLVMSQDGAVLSDDRYSAEKDWSSALGKVSLTYSPSQKLNFYALVSQGYTPGGFNYTTAAKEFADFNETKSMNYEVGVKSKLFNNRVMLNANVFHTDYDDLQVLEAEYMSTIFSVKNAGKAHVTGVEADFAARLAKGLDIFATAGLMEAKYDDFYVSGVDYDDKYMIGAPKFTGTAGVTYRHSSGLVGIFDIKHTGKTYFTKSNTDKIEDSYEILNVKAGYESAKGYEVYLYVRNLTDKEYFTWMRDGGANMSYNYMGEPRTVGMEVNYRF
ncbi:TonB-dependent receptor [Seleniivibrio woodruffii]|uniref:TonB-dependent receptor n=1 Tax=Seleniivibrio woodruffii TaxID=1078050 RepID=UPI0026EC5CDF|nr:TonB-dependent receptor [Seleniivibrio woodruffii]